MLDSSAGRFSIDDITEFINLMQLYEGAMYEVSTKLEILDDEFQVRFSHDPIHHMERRLKSIKSIIGKLKRRDLPITVESVRDNLFDVAGIRVICNYRDDVYSVSNYLSSQSDIQVLRVKDYIKNPKQNGYRSLHLDVRVPVYLSNRTEHVVAEIQIRTIAMDFWASLEHDIHYKADRAKLPAGIDEEMFVCAEKIAEIDRQMQDMYRRIADSEANADAAKK